jgi:hypothetical protein
MTKKRFDESILEVSCNDCEHYYQSECDGHSTVCNSFKVARMGKIDTLLSRICRLIFVLTAFEVLNTILILVRCKN